jgi:adenylate kinase
VGIPGVGKGTVIHHLLRIAKAKGTSLTYVLYGDVMMRIAAKRKIKDRDELRKLSVKEQQKIQLEAAKKIHSISHHFLILDTHLLIRTKEGYLPGVPQQILEELAPTNLILVDADPAEVAARRAGDTSRARDKLNVEEIKSELELSKQLLLTTSALSGCPFMIVRNSEGKAEEAAATIASALKI